MWPGQRGIVRIESCHKVIVSSRHLADKLYVSGIYLVDINAAELSAQHHFPFVFVVISQNINYFALELDVRQLVILIAVAKIPSI